MLIGDIQTPHIHDTTTLPLVLKIDHDNRIYLKSVINIELEKKELLFNDDSHVLWTKDNYDYKYNRVFQDYNKSTYITTSIKSMTLKDDEWLGKYKRITTLSKKMDKLDVYRKNCSVGVSVVNLKDILTNPISSSRINEIITYIKKRYEDFEIDKEYVINFDDIRWPIARSTYIRSINIPIKDIKSITIDYKILKNKTWIDTSSEKELLNTMPSIINMQESLKHPIVYTG